MRTSTLRPGLLVSLRTSVTGNVSYQTREIEPDHVTQEGTARAVWETARTVREPAEQEAAVKLRSRCRGLITAVCAASAFGLLCPEDDADKLSAALDEAQALAADFNRRAVTTRLVVYAIAGRIAPDDVQAVRAINAEVRELLAAMETGLRDLDVKAVREAANKARSLGAMLSPAAAERVMSAVDAARSCARKIVQAGEVASAEIDRTILTTLATARTAFLDLDDDDREFDVPVITGRALDLVPETSAPRARYPETLA